MKLEKWALVAEIMGSLAVVVTLIILIVEVRGNTAAIREQTIDAQRYAENERRTRIIANVGGLTDLIMKHRTGESLTATEDFRVRLHYNDVLDNFEWQFRKVRASGLSIEQLNAQVWRNMMVNERGLAESFERSKSERDPEFVRFLEQGLVSD